MSGDTKRELTTEEWLYIWGWIMLPVVLGSAYVVVRWIIPAMPATECVFWKFWGIYCPGCGGTRAVTAFMQGDFLMSAWYHPLVAYLALMYCCFMLSHTLEKLHVPLIKGMKFHEWIMYGALVVIAANFVLKNVLKFCFHIVM